MSMSQARGCDSVAPSITPPAYEKAGMLIG